MHYLHYLLICALSTFLFFNSAQATGKQLSSAKKGAILVAVVKIRKGEKIQKRMIVERSMPEDDIPQDAVELRSLIIGQKPSHDLPPTKVIQDSDFLDLHGINVPFVYTTKEIPVGAVFQKSDLEVVQHIYFRRVPSLSQRPINISVVVGKKASRNLLVHHQITENDIIP